MQFTRWEITVSAHLAASLANAIQVLRCSDRERSCVRPQPNSSIRRRERLPPSFGELRAYADNLTYAQERGGYPKLETYCR